MVVKLFLVQAISVPRKCTAGHSCWIFLYICNPYVKHCEGSQKQTYATVVYVTNVKKLCLSCTVAEKIARYRVLSRTARWQLVRWASLDFAFSAYRLGPLELP